MTYKKIKNRVIRLHTSEFQLLIIMSSRTCREFVLGINPLFKFFACVAWLNQYFIPVQYAFGLLVYSIP